MLLSVEKVTVINAKLIIANVALTGTLGIPVKETGPQYPLLIVNWNSPSNDTAIVTF